MQKYILLLTVIVSVCLVLSSCSTIAASEAAQKTVIIDAGHGGEDCGTIGKNGVFEKDLNLRIAFTLGKLLEEKGYAVVYTRTEDKLLYKEEENIKGYRKIYDLKNRAALASQYESPVFISIHMNSFSDERYSGLQVFYSVATDASRRLATSVQQQVKQQLQPQNNRPIREGAGLYLMENLSCPAILIECGFMSNPAECEKLCQKEYQKQLCFAIACGIIEVQNTL